MSRKRFKPEEIVNKLRESDVLISQGRTVAQASKQIGVAARPDAGGATAGGSGRAGAGLYGR